MSGLSCGMQDLHCIRRGSLWWCTDFLAAACRLSGSVAGGILVPRPGIEPESSAVQGEFLTAGPPGKSLFGPLKRPTLLCCLESTHCACLVSVVFPLLDISIPNLPSLEAPTKIFLVRLLCARDSQACGVGMKVKSLGHVQLFATPGTVAYQAPPSMGFSRQEYWSGLPFPSPGGLPSPGIEPGPPTLQADAFPSEPPGVA